jgi:hypothetical protein
MAKKTEVETALATVTPQETAVATRSAALAVADNAKAGDTRGTENIDNDDVRVPFLSIAQKTSKAIDPSESAKYIAGLQFGQMYNSETKEVYPANVPFIPILMRKRAHLLGENGKLGPATDWDDPRVTFEGRPQGEKPEGQRIYDWVVVLLPSFEIVVISFKSKSFGAGKSLNNFVKLRKPAFAGKYEISTFIDKNTSGSFGVFAVKPAGKPTEAEFEFAEMAFESHKDKNIVAEGEVIDDVVRAAEGSEDYAGAVEGATEY